MKIQHVGNALGVVGMLISQQVHHKLANIVNEHVTPNPEKKGEQSSVFRPVELEPALNEEH